jgi:hypothetical protein
MIWLLIYFFFSYPAAMSSDTDSSNTCINEQVSDTVAVYETTSEPVVDEPTADEPTSESVVDENTSEPVEHDLIVPDSEHVPEVNVACNNESQLPTDGTENSCAENKDDVEPEVPVESVAAEDVHITSEEAEDEAPAALTTAAPSAVLDAEDENNDKNVISSPAVPALEQSSHEEPTPKARGGRSYQESRRSKKSGAGAAVGSGEKSKTATNGKSERRPSGDDDSSSCSTKSCVSDVEHQGKGDVKEPASMKQKGKDTDKPVDTNVDRRPASDGDSLASGNKAAEKCDLHSG